jgi:hypothetical protein
MQPPLPQIIGYIRVSFVAHLPKFLEIFSLMIFRAMYFILQHVNLFPTHGRGTRTCFKITLCFRVSTGYNVCFINWTSVYCTNASARWNGFVEGQLMLLQPSAVRAVHGRSQQVQATLPDNKLH